MKRSCSVVPQRTNLPCCGSRQSLAISARISNCWASDMRGSGGISKARNSTSPSRPVGAVGRIELVDADFGAMGIAGDVDQNVPEQPVHQPQRGLDSRRRHMGERDFQFIEAVMPGLVDARRLAGRADEHAREQIGQRRMPLPVQHQALQQIRTAQERQVRRRAAADHDMIAAAGAGVAAVDQKTVGAEPDLRGVLVEAEGDVDGFAPAWSPAGC